MNSTVDTTALLAPATARFDRQRSDARQQRWMAELEQAMLAQQPARPIEAAPQQQDDGHGTAAAQGADSADAAAATAPAAATKAAAPHAQASQEAGQSGETGTHAATADADEAPRAQRGKTSGPINGMAPSYGTAVALPSAAAISPGVAVLQPAVAAAAALRPGMADVTAAAAIEVAAAERPAAAGLAPFGSAPAGEEAAHAGFAAPEEGAAAGEQAAEADEYAQRLLHLFHGDDGVQAYIRDAELGGAQLRAVAQALALELGAGGQRLAGLTVNGRRVTLGDTAAEEEQAPVTAYDAAAPRIIEKGQH